MKSANQSLELGQLVCVHCGSIIDTLDTERVIKYHGDCGREECIRNRNQDNDADMLEH